MKAEHRKELETNVLADRMGKAMQRMKEGPSRNTMLVVGGIVVVVVLFLVWSLVKRSSENASSGLWEQWYALATPTDLENFTKEHGGTFQGRLARFREARLDLVQGVSDLGSPIQRNQALERVRRAAETYEALIAESANVPVLQQEALLNAGKAYETLEDVAKAKGLYQRLIKAYPKTQATRDAEACLQRLEGGTKDLDTLKKLMQESAKPSK